MKKNILVCQYCESSVPEGAASMHSCGKVWYPFSSETKGICPHCKKEEEFIICPYCKGPSKYETWLNQAEVLEKRALEREKELKNRKGFKWLEKIIDDCLEKMKHKGNMKVPGPIPKEMRDNSEEYSDTDWSPWKPTKSTNDDVILDEFEIKYNIKLPPSYRHYLKYKHFFNLQTINDSVILPNHIPVQKLEDLTGHDIHQMDFINKGFLYFAYYKDYAFLCFDTNQMKENGECPIVAFDHEQFYLPEHIDEDEGEYIYASFEEVLIAKEKWYHGEN